MLKKLLLPMFLGFLLSPASEMAGQNLSALGTKAEQLVKARRPSWKLLNKSEYERQTSFSWGTLDKGISVLLFVGNSPSEAAKEMAYKNDRISVGPGLRRKGLGDEAYSATEDRPGHEFAIIRFRKKSTYIEVRGQSVKLVESVARDLERTIK